jgi:1-acyl-sn-glycerol-3-phosphate acyltransferase
MLIRIKFIKLFQTIVTRSIAGLLRPSCTITVHRQPEIDPSKRYLFVANHQSRLDAFALFAKVPHKTQSQISPIRYMTAGSIFYSWLWPVLKGCGCFPTRKKSDTSYSAVDQSLAYLNEGQNVFIFPEGQRTLRRDSNPRNGVQRIIQEYKGELTIVLVHVEWSHPHNKRHLDVTFAPYDGRSDDPKTIMDAVYAL